MMKLLKAIAKWITQLGLLLIGLTLLYSCNVFGPEQPDRILGDWTWIDAPRFPIPWMHGWWLNCQAQNNTDRCTLEAGQSHEVVYSGVYLPCDGDAPLPQDALNHPLAPNHSNYMWIRVEPNDQLAPVVFLPTPAAPKLLVPASAHAQCAALKQSTKPAF